MRMRKVAGGLMSYGANLPHLIRRSAAKDDLGLLAGSGETVVECFEGGVVTAGAEGRHVEDVSQGLRQQQHVEPVLRHIDSNEALLHHPRVPSLLMRARALATVREWKKRLEHQAHSRPCHRGGYGLPAAMGAVSRPPSPLTMLLSRHPRRRDLLGGTLASIWIGTAGAQQRPLIAILHSGFPHRTPIDQLYAALRDLGHEHERTAEIELLGAEGDAERLTSFVGHLVQEHPQVTIAVTSPAALALKRANLTTPVVFLFVSDPIRLGLVDSLPRPGGNYTGVTFSDAFLGAKRLELLTDAVPGIRTVAVLWSSSFQENAALVESIRSAGKALNVEVATVEIGNVARLPAAFDEAVAARAQAVI